ncbi:CDP-alcohol phosphatidyltransferase family protein [Nocardioides sp. LHG3406-4]|uniref:CDP-alcohol phosphatidyltransferase family protein n=1 Tax=Nocardioides sp. LHG3406-4 TaxID=2804575 RepID=UPI003CE6BA30
MHRVQASGPLIGFAGLLALLGGLTATVGLSAVGWLVGVLSGAVLATTLGSALVRRGVLGIGPAGRVTLVRAVIACSVAALTADSFVRPTPVATLVTLSGVGLLLDAVDGHVARRTGTVTPLGARFDMEVDAFLIAVLSVYVAPEVGAWVLAIGAMRYAYVAAGWVLRSLRRPTPPRYWAKVVAAVQGVVLAVAAADLLPRAWAQAALAVALALLLESFGRDVWWQCRHRRDAPAVAPLRRPRAGITVTVLSVALVWLALVLPDRVQDMTPGVLVRLPLEGIVLVGVTLLLPAGPRRWVASVFGLLLGLLVVVKVLDAGFLAVLDRPFSPVSDWVYFGPGIGVLADSIGRPAAIATAVVASALVVVLLVVLTLSARRLTRAAAEHRRGTARALTALTTVWVLCAVSGLVVGPVGQVASTGAAGLAVDQVQAVRADLRDRHTFAREIATDHARATPAGQLLEGLRGKDVLLVFVESYGRVAVQDSSFSPGIDAVLQDGTRRLHAAGYSSRSAFLTSPTFGAASWLAHATMQSGLWVDSQRRYEQLLGADRLTLTRAFGSAGWRTVSDVPADTRDWPEGKRFYGFDQMYDARNVGYAGPKFGYASMPDQYTLEHLRRTELAPSNRKPVMAEIDLVSSHHPWTPLPHPVPWDQVGDGSVFNGMPEQGEQSEDVFRDPDAVRRVYGESVEYTMDTLVSFLEQQPDPDLVLVVLGDHQPHSYVSGADPGHDVPVSVIAQDPAVVRRISSWDWQDGLLPAPDAPVWRMDTFRDRFFSAFGGRPQ